MNRVDFAEDAGFEEMSNIFLLPDRSGLHNDTEYWYGARRILKTNNVGLRGPDLDPSRKLAVIWGDSLVWGGWDGETWIEVLNELYPSYLFQNAGLPGDSILNVVDRASTMNSKFHIDLNIIVGGWHPSTLEGGSDIPGIYDLLSQKLTDVPRLALATCPTALNAAILDRDIRGLESEPVWEDRFYNELDPAGLSRWFGALLVRNEMIRIISLVKRLPLFDWYQLLRSTSLDDYKEDFFDRFHLRKSASRKVAAEWAAWLSTTDFR